jgi:hypothetical protein
MPCATHLSSEVCSASAITPIGIVLAGDPDLLYELTVRFRGVVERASYTGGEADGYFQIGGAPVNDGLNVYSLATSSPWQTYYLNRGTSVVMATVAVDYTVAIQAYGNTLVSLQADPIDGQQLLNLDEADEPVVIPDIPPAPDAYDGQFLQMDVVSVSVVE